MKDSIDEDSQSRLSDMNDVSCSETDFKSKSNVEKIEMINLNFTKKNNPKFITISETNSPAMNINPAEKRN